MLIMLVRWAKFTFRLYLVLWFTLVFLISWYGTSKRWNTT